MTKPKKYPYRTYKGKLTRRVKKANRKRPVTARGWFYAKLMLNGGMLPKDELERQLGYPTTYERTLKLLSITSEISEKKIDGTTMIVLRKGGLEYMQKLATKKPHAIEKHFAADFAAHNIDLWNYPLPKV